MVEAVERISCLMVTLPSPERFEFLKRSVACYCAQTYANRELVVVFDEGPPEQTGQIKDHLAALHENVTIVHPQTKHTLGALRNLGVEAASSPVVCQWDDDDFSHPTRLVEQHRLLVDERAIAVALQEVLHLFPHSREMYWINYRNTPDQCDAGTVMFRRSVRVRSPESGPHAVKGEDSALMRSLKAEGHVAYLARAPHLYVYVYHGGNTCGDEHHRLLSREISVSRGLLQRWRSVFDHLGCFDLGADTIDVVGNNGPAFQIPGRKRAFAGVLDNGPARS